MTEKQYRFYTEEDVEAKSEAKFWKGIAIGMAFVVIGGLCLFGYMYTLVQ